MDKRIESANNSSASVTVSSYASIGGNIGRAAQWMITPSSNTNWVKVGNSTGSAAVISSAFNGQGRQPVYFVAGSENTSQEERIAVFNVTSKYYNGYSKTDTIRIIQHAATDTNPIVRYEATNVQQSANKTSIEPGENVRFTAMYYVYAVHKNGDRDLISSNRQSITDEVVTSSGNYPTNGYYDSEYDLNIDGRGVYVTVESPVTYTYHVDLGNYSFDFDSTGGQNSFTVDSYYVASNNSTHVATSWGIRNKTGLGSWCTVSTSGNTVTVNVSSTTSTSSSEGSFEVYNDGTYQTFTVRRSGAAAQDNYTISVSPTSKSGVSASGTSFTASLTIKKNGSAASDYSNIDVDSSESWIVVSGTGSSRTVLVEENDTSSSRSGTITWGYHNDTATTVISQNAGSQTPTINGIELYNISSEIKPSNHPYIGTSVYLETSYDWRYTYSNGTTGTKQGSGSKQSSTTSAQSGTNTISDSWQVTHGGYTKTLSGSASYTGMNNYAYVYAYSPTNPASSTITLDSYMSGGSGYAEASVEKNSKPITSGYLITATTSDSWLNQPTVDGDIITITAKEGNPNSTERRGSFFVSAVVDGVDPSNVDGTNYYVIQPGIPVQHRITSSGNFYIEGDGYEYVNDGDSITFTVFANDSYEFSSKPSFSHGTVGGWSSRYANITITNVTSDITLTCTSGLTAKQTTTYTLTLSQNAVNLTEFVNTINVDDYISTNSPAGTALIYSLSDDSDSAFTINGSMVSVLRNTTTSPRSCKVMISQNVTNGKSAKLTITQAAGTIVPVPGEGYEIVDDYEIVLGTNEMSGTGSTTIQIKKNGSVISPNWSNVVIGQDPKGYAEAMMSDYGNTQRVITVTRNLGMTLKPIKSSFFIEYYVDGVSVANTPLVITWDLPDAV